MKTEVRLITPTVAKQMMKMNHGNRPISVRHVKFLSAEMKNGNWMFDGQPIRFTGGGRLLDGQHRLEAVILSGTAQEFLILTGIHQEAFKVMDTGSNRTAADILGIEGMKNSSALASSVRKVLSHKNSSNAAYNLRFSNTDIVDFIEKNRDIIKIVNRSAVQYVSFRLLPSSTIGSMQFLTHERDVVGSEIFWNKLCSGEGLEHGDPILLLRNKLFQNKLLDKKCGFREQKALIVKTWNHFRKGNNTMKQLKVNLNSEKNIFVLI